MCLVRDQIYMSIALIDCHCEQGLHNAEISERLHVEGEMTGNAHIMQW